MSAPHNPTQIAEAFGVVEAHINREIDIAKSDDNPIRVGRLKSFLEQLHEEACGLSEE